jgi:hypothetical protein
MASNGVQVFADKFSASNGFAMCFTCDGNVLKENDEVYQNKCATCNKTFDEVSKHWMKQIDEYNTRFTEEEQAASEEIVRRDHSNSFAPGFVQAKTRHESDTDDDFDWGAINRSVATLFEKHIRDLFDEDKNYDYFKQEMCKELGEDITDWAAKYNQIYESLDKPRRAYMNKSIREKVKENDGSNESKVEIAQYIYHVVAGNITSS